MSAPRQATATGAPSWAARAQAVAARPASSAECLPLLEALWASGPLVPPLDDAAWQRLAAQVHFARVRAGQTLIAQDEPGDFLLVLLDGSVRVEHQGGGGAAPIGLGEGRPGDVLGEMALLDAGPRSSACITRTDCLVAVLEMDALARLMHDDAPLAAALMAALARRLSLRLRQTDARLLALLSDD